MAQQRYVVNLAHYFAASRARRLHKRAGTVQGWPARWESAKATLPTPHNDPITGIGGRFPIPPSAYVWVCFLSGGLSQEGPVAQVKTTPS